MTTTTATNTLDVYRAASLLVTASWQAQTAAVTTPPDADPPTLAYALAELNNAHERIRAAITQLEGLQP